MIWSAFNYGLHVHRDMFQLFDVVAYMGPALAVLVPGSVRAYF